MRGFSASASSHSSEGDRSEGWGPEIVSRRQQRQHCLLHAMKHRIWRRRAPRAFRVFRSLAHRVIDWYPHPWLGLGVAVPKFGPVSPTFAHKNELSGPNGAGTANHVCKTRNFERGFIGMAFCLLSRMPPRAPRSPHSDAHPDPHHSPGRHPALPVGKDWL